MVQLVKGGLLVTKFMNSKPDACGVLIQWLDTDDICLFGVEQVFPVKLALSSMLSS